MEADLGERELPRRWLVVRLSALGDVVLATGLLDLLCRERGWRFAFLTREAHAPVLAGHPAVDEVVRQVLEEVGGHA